MLSPARGFINGEPKRDRFCSLLLGGMIGHQTVKTAQREEARTPVPIRLIFGAENAAAKRVVRGMVRLFKNTTAIKLVTPGY
jgi:hypothetical protein